MSPLKTWLPPEAGVTLPSVSMDRRLQELKRKAASGDRLAAWRLALERYRLGEWLAGRGEGESYRESLLRAGEQEGLTFLDVQGYKCGGQAKEVARIGTHLLTLCAGVGATAKSLSALGKAVPSPSPL